MDSSEHAYPIHDPRRIDLDNPAEVVAWCVLFKLAEADLRTAVGIIGPMSAAVAVYINSRGRRGAVRQVGEIGQPFERRPSSSGMACETEAGSPVADTSRDEGHG